MNLRGEILNAIGRDAFNYADYFPDSDNAKRFGFVVSDVMVGAKLREHLAIARLAPSTRLTYERVCTRYLYTWFDRVRLRDLSAPMIRAKVLAIRKGDDGPPVTLKTARNILAPLGAMLETAVGDGDLDVNPLAAVKLERFWPEAQVTSDFEADPFAWSELVAIFGACEGGEEEDYWRFAFGTGLRPSEQIERTFHPAFQEFSGSGGRCSCGELFHVERPESARFGWRCRENLPPVSHAHHGMPPMSPSSSAIQAASSRPVPISER
jgi:integrase